MTGTLSAYQSFKETVDPAQSAPRLSALRAELARRSLDGFIIPRADSYQNEYVPASQERLAWLTGFTGSAGAAVVLAQEAALFTDGRYALQVREQTDSAFFDYCDLASQPPSQWLIKKVQTGWRIGFDPWLHTPAQAEKLRRSLEAVSAKLIAVDQNPLDAVWLDRPAEPARPISLRSIKLAGESAASKRARLLALSHPADGVCVSDPHAVAWLFNIRGADVAHTPLPLARAYIPVEGAPHLYIDAKKLSPETRAALEKEIRIVDPAELSADLAALGGTGKRICFDAATIPEALITAYCDTGGVALLGEDSANRLKACKNAAELRGMREAHLRDGAALTKFLHFFDQEAPNGRLTEISAAVILEAYRNESKKLCDLSFPTISAFGAHAASPHYRVTEKSNARIKNGIYLTDSGAQYLDGTTDVTRTVVVGRPTAEMRDRFTRVLKGHIAIASCVFPQGTTGAQIDAFARRALWDAGLDFDHGTGHGVGAFLSVHEGPARISKLGGVMLEAGMILSDEPGYYKSGAYGVRIENLLLVEKRIIKGAERPMLGFDVLTLAPIALTLVETKLLTPAELYWLNGYHARVRSALSPLVETKTRAWLKQATCKLS